MLGYTIHHILYTPLLQLANDALGVLYNMYVLRDHPCITSAKGLGG